MLLQWLIAELYETNTGEAVFWSGTTLGIDATSRAEQVALSLGGTTLEKLVRSRGIHLPPWDATSPASVSAWVLASKAYASCASGCARAVLGDSLRPGNIWETVELPTLKANPQVTQ